MIEDPRYRAAAGRMATRLAAERDDNLVVDELERIAADPRARPLAGADCRAEVGAVPADTYRGLSHR
jgi:hypothetical protein